MRRLSRFRLTPSPVCLPVWVGVFDGGWSGIFAQRHIRLVLLTEVLLERSRTSPPFSNETKTIKACFVPREVQKARDANPRRHACETVSQDPPENSRGHTLFHTVTLRPGQGKRPAIVSQTNTVLLPLRGPGWTTTRTERGGGGGEGDTFPKSCSRVGQHSLPMQSVELPG